MTPREYIINTFYVEKGNNMTNFALPFLYDLGRGCRSNASVDVATWWTQKVYTAFIGVCSSVESLFTRIWTQASGVHSLNSVFQSFWIHWVLTGQTVVSQMEGRKESRMGHNSSRHILLRPCHLKCNCRRSRSLRSRKVQSYEMQKPDRQLSLPTNSIRDNRLLRSLHAHLHDRKSVQASWCHRGPQCVNLAIRDTSHRHFPLKRRQHSVVLHRRPVPEAASKGCQMSINQPDAADIATCNWTYTSSIFFNLKK